MTHAVETDGLVKTYSGGITALDGLSIKVGPGEVLGLLGPNGAGKSTTIKILTTLVQPDSGTANVAGYGVRRQADRVRRAIGVVSQRSGADPMASGRDNEGYSRSSGRGRPEGGRGRWMQVRDLPG